MSSATVAWVAALDRRLLRLAERGITPPHTAAQGFEGALVAMGEAISPSDWVFWGRTICAPALTRGAEAEVLLAHAFDGLELGELAARRIVTCTLGPATRVPQAAGLAWAAREDGIAALVELGEDALSDGDVHVGLNFAAVLDSPLVVVVRSTGRRPVVERGEGYGVAALSASAAYDEALPALTEAMGRARIQRQPQLVELRRTNPSSAAAIAAHDDAVEQALRAAEARVAARHPTTLTEPHGATGRRA